MKEFILNILYLLLIVIACIIGLPMVVAVMALAIIVCIILLPFALIVEIFNNDEVY